MIIWVMVAESYFAHHVELYLDDTPKVIKRFSFVAVVLYIGSFETLYLVCIISVLCISQLAFIMKVDIHFTLRRRRLLHMLHSTVSANFISQNNFELDSKILTIFNPTNESKSKYVVYLHVQVHFSKLLEKVLYSCS